MNLAPLLLNADLNVLVVISVTKPIAVHLEVLIQPDTDYGLANGVLVDLDPVLWI